MLKLIGIGATGRPDGRISIMDENIFVGTIEERDMEKLGRSTTSETGARSGRSVRRTGSICAVKRWQRGPSCTKTMREEKIRVIDCY